MIDLGLLLHIYQPPDRLDHLVHRIAQDCYRPLLAFIESHPHYRLSLNLNWCLTEKWLERNLNDCVERLDRMVSSEQVELTGTAAYHPILPLIPVQEMQRQVSFNESRHRELFRGWDPKGFFPPELAFGHELVPVLMECRYRWCLTDDIPYTCLNDEPPFTFVPVCGELPVLLRSSHWSRALEATARQGGDGRFLAQRLVEDVSDWFDGRDGYLVLALEGEAFGEHRAGSLDVCLRGFLDGLLESGQVCLSHLDEIVDRFPHQESDVPPGSWRTSVEDFWNGEFFPFWQSRYNEAHALLWELTELAVASVGQLQAKLDRSLNSGNFWWATREMGQIPDGTARGMKMLLDVIATAAPDQVDRALDLMARLDSLFEPDL